MKVFIFYFIELSTSIVAALFNVEFNSFFYGELAKLKNALARLWLRIDKFMIAFIKLIILVFNKTSTLFDYHYFKVNYIIFKKVNCIIFKKVKYNSNLLKNSFTNFHNFELS